jgi:hypothetical protein
VSEITRRRHGDRFEPEAWSTLGCMKITDPAGPVGATMPPRCTSASITPVPE